MKTICGRIVAGVAMMVFVGGCATEPGSSTHGKSAGMTRTSSTSPGPVFESGATHVPPVMIHQVVPQYPFKMSNAGVEGVVVVRLAVTREGNVGSVAVSRSTRMEFEMAALDAARQLKFTPALVDGVPVACVIEIPMTFSLEKN